MSEKYLRTQIKRQWKILKTYRIENACDPGMPDIFFINPKRLTGFIELKKINSFNCKIKFQPFQPFWIDQYSKLGGYVFVLVYVINAAKYVLLSPDDIINYSKLKLKNIKETLLISDTLTEVQTELLNYGFESIKQNNL